jgi:hypothetical protein
VILCAKRTCEKEIFSFELAAPMQLFINLDWELLLPFPLRTTKFNLGRPGSLHTGQLLPRSDLMYHAEAKQAEGKTSMVC